MMRILMSPDYRAHNEYQSRLAGALQLLDTEVRFPDGYRRGLPLYRSVRDHYPVDVLHLHWIEPFIRGRSAIAYHFYWRKFLWDCWMVRRSGTRIYWTLHNLVPHECLCEPAEIRYRKRFARAVDGVIVHGESGKANALDLLEVSHENVLVSKHGNFVSGSSGFRSREEARRVLGISEDAFLFLFAGLVRRYKGVTRLIEAFKRLVGDDLRLQLVGSSSERALSNEIREKLEGDRRIDWVDQFVSEETLQCWLAASNVVVMPFQQVQTSGSVILAMSASRPVIAPRLGDVRETLGEAGDLLYSSEDPDGLESSMVTSMQVDLDELGARSRAEADRLDWDVIASSTLEFFRRSV